MSYYTITPGNGFGFSVNAHRQGWDGTICRDPCNWECGQDLPFREKNCDAGRPYCFHLQTFAGDQPWVEAHEQGIGWLLKDNPHVLDDQVLLFWGGAAAEPQGQKQGAGFQMITVGAYRVQSVEKITIGTHLEKWRIFPHPDGWTRFASLEADQPRWSKIANGPYIREVDGHAIRRVFEQADRIVQRSEGGSWFLPEDEARFRDFHSNLDRWLEEARTRMQKLRDDAPKVAVAQRVVWDGASRGNALLKDLSKLVKGQPVPAARPASAAAGPGRVETAEEASAPTPAADPDAGQGRTTAAPSGATDAAVPEEPLMTPARRAWVAQHYSEEVAEQMVVACATKPIVLLRGQPGVGKSFLACNLLPPGERDRRLAIPVASTWRGREDLLGYTNPVDGRFEPTPFTRFLVATEAAWHGGDRRPRVVVFEEINLSQPEHWFADVLAVLQYPDLEDRHLELGGQGIAGIDASGSRGDRVQEIAVRTPARVLLPTNLHFFGTLNSDHTVRPLSPRVLDRSSLIEVKVKGSDILSHMDLELAPAIHEAIMDLDFAMRTRGASISRRSALSIRRCLADPEGLGLPPTRAIDLVLIQEVLSKVRLMAGDPNDEAFLKDLVKWKENHGELLTQVSSLIDDWAESIRAGLDVIQA